LTNKEKTTMYVPDQIHKENPTQAGVVRDLDDPSAYWDGQFWTRKGHHHKPKKHHRLVGVPGTAYEGWTYDWGQRGWREPGHNVPDPPSTAIATVGSAGGGAVVGAGAAKGGALSACGTGFMDNLKNISLAEGVGIAALIAAELPEPPVPPTFTDAMTDTDRANAQAIYNQNQQQFDRRMSKYRTIGFGLLGVTAGQQVLSMLQGAK
jgi:hypothetical protein